MVWSYFLTQNFKNRHVFQRHLPHPPCARKSFVWLAGWQLPGQWSGTVQCSWHWRLPICLSWHVRSHTTCPGGQNVLRCSGKAPWNVNLAWQTHAVPLALVGLVVLVGRCPGSSREPETCQGNNNCWSTAGALPSCPVWIEFAQDGCSHYGPWTL